MALGPMVAAIGLGVLARIDAGHSYVTDVFPGVVAFGLGLSLTVAPLTAAVLAAVDRGREGIGSGVNNAVARVAGLLAVAVLPVISGISDVERLAGTAFSAGFRQAMLVSAALCALGGAISWFGMAERQPVDAHGPPPCVDHPHGGALRRERVGAGP